MIDVRGIRKHPAALALAALLLAGGASAQPNPPGPNPPGPNGPGKEPPPSRAREVGRKAGDIAMQPARDVGVSKTEIPPVLVKAHEDPYSLKGLNTCRQLADAVKELNVVLGPDFVVGTETKENRAARLAEAGGRTVINSLLPYRGLVREISGAAPAQRRLDAALDAGFARRGFLRGVHTTRKCRGLA